MNYYDKNGSSYLQHYGVLRMKWGVRRYQNPDGTLTEEGKKRYTASYRYGQKIKPVLTQEGKDHFRVHDKVYKLDFETPKKQAMKEMDELMKNSSIQSWKRGGMELHRRYQEKVAEDWVKKEVENYTDEDLRRYKWLSAYDDMFPGEGFDRYMNEHMGKKGYDEFMAKVSAVHGRYTENLKKQAESFVKDLSDEPIPEFDNGSVKSLVLDSILNEASYTDFAYLAFDSITKLQYDY